MPIPLTAQSVSDALNVPLPKGYQANAQMLERVIKTIPDNTDINMVCAKIVLVDYVYSTNLKMYRKKCTVLDIAQAIIGTADFDDRVNRGDPTVVKDILDKLSVNLFSFVSKYCFVHNYYAYCGDSYSIYDSTVKKLLPEYVKNHNVIPKFTGRQLENIVKAKDYEKFNDIVGRLIATVNVKVPSPRRAFDRFIWNQR